MIPTKFNLIINKIEKKKKFKTKNKFNINTLYK